MPFYPMIDKVVEYIKTTQSIKEDKWISGDEAMQRLSITSKTTLQKFRYEGKIRFSHPE